MVFLLAFAVLVLSVSSVAVWSRTVAEPAAARPWRPDGLPPPGEMSVSSEGMLAAQLAVGDITHEQYAGAMERLAAHDEFRHPLEVPPDR
jgi:hypothetical protein